MRLPSAGNAASNVLSRAAANRVCEPGGHVLLLTSAYQFLWSHHDEVVHHKRRYRRQELNNLLQCTGFQVLTTTYVNTILFPPILGVRIAQRFHGALRGPSQSSLDLLKPGRVINGALYFLLCVEATLLKFMTFPFGVGILALARKPRSCLPPVLRLGSDSNAEKATATTS
jgi:hypothetical protein